MTKHKYKDTGAVTGTGIPVLECSTCGKKTTQKNDKTFCELKKFTPLVQAARKRYKEASFKFLNTQNDDHYLLPYKRYPKKSVDL